MNIKAKLFRNILASVFLMGVVMAAGCKLTSTTGNTTTESTTLPWDIESHLTISKAPKIGETVDLTFTVDVIRLQDEQYHPSAGLAKSKAWLDFYWTNTQGSYSEAYSSVQIPVDEAVVSGEFPWEGSYSKGFTLHSKIKLPREGIWSIRGNFIGEGWSYGTGAAIEVAVADGTAAIMGTPEFMAGPLAYLGNNSYACGVRGPVVPTEINPVSLGLDISKAPRPGESVTLSCRITSLVDMPDVSIQWYFYRRIGDNKQEIPAAELLSIEDLGWKTDVKKDVPVVFSTTIKFPSEGDWEIIAAGKSGTNYLTDSGHILKMRITSTISYFGWEERPVIWTTTNTPPGTTTTAQR